LFDIAQQKLLLSQSELENAANDLKIQKQNEEILKQRFDSSQQATSIVSLKKKTPLVHLN
jgi:hypothetical protein